MNMLSGNRKNAVRLIAVFVLSATVCGTAYAQARATAQALPRLADGKPNLQGIWQVRDKVADDLLQTKGIVEGGAIPYLTAATAKKQDNLKNRKAADPLEKCFLPGVPRIMYLEYPFQIFQTSEHVAMTFTWSQVYRLIYTNGKKGRGIESWMGDSRGHWDGDTLVVEVKDLNDQTWLDSAGNYHSSAMTVVERYHLLDADTIQYEATITDPMVYSKPWKMTIAFRRLKDVPRLLEYQCQAEKEEANGAFQRDPRTWYSPQSPKPSPLASVPTLPDPATGANLNGLRKGSRT